MPNSIWKGQLSFGLVSIPIIVYSTLDKSESISFRQIDKRNNARIKHQRVNVETGKEVPWQDVVRGYEYEKGEILIVGEGELEKIAGENAKTIAIESFVDKKHLNTINIDKSYYLVPDKKGEKGYVILRDALMQTNKIGIAKIIISTKEYLAALTTFEDALVVYTLHYPEEIRPLSQFDIPSADSKKYKVTNKEIEIAKQLINSMTTKWRPNDYKDEYKEAVHTWLQNKLKHKPTSKMKPRGKMKGSKEITSFADLLKQSITNKKSTQSKSKNDKQYKKSAKNDKKYHAKSSTRKRAK